MFKYNSMELGRMANTPDENAQEEFVDQIRSEYKDELKEEILSELGETYTVWVHTAKPDVQTCIGEVAIQLERLLRAVRESNHLSASDQLVSDIARAQLIAILQTALEELKAPMIDRGRFRNLGNALVQLTKRSAEAAASRELQDAFHSAVDGISKLTAKLMELSGSDDWLN